MSLKSKFFSAITLAFAFVAFSTFVSAQETNTDKDQNSTQKQERREWRGKFGKGDRMGKGFRGGKRGGILRGLRELNLTDAQKEQIRTIMEANRPDQATMEERRTLHQAKRDGTLTDAQKERLKTLRQEGRAKSEQIEQQILNILTPEQRQQLEQKQQEMKKRWEERKQLRQQNKQTPQTENKDN